MASGQVASRLSQLESTSNAQQRADGYNQTLDTILTSFTNGDLSTNLIAYAQSILSDNIGVIHSRPLLSDFVEKYKSIEDNDVKIEAGTEIVQIILPKIVSFEQQDTDIKFALADAYEAGEDFVNSAKTLQTVNLESQQGRTVTGDEKAAVWMRICRCYLEEEDPTNALSHLNKIKNIIFDVKDHATRLQFQLSQARINDSQRNFLDASSSYHALSTEPAIDEEERLRSLSAAITTAVLAPAGPTRARQLGRLYKDDRATETPEYSILEKIFLDRLLSPEEVAAFAAGLQEHQLAKTSDGSTVLDKAVLEHNLVATSRLYQNIPIASLGALLGVDADRAEAYTAAMIESSRLSGSIDQISELVHFFPAPVGQDSGTSVDLNTRDLRTWEANIAHVSEEVEKVTTLLQREAPAYYASVMEA